MIIQASGIWKTFGRFHALQDFSLGVPEGSTFALVGANGAGKTTTIKLLMNIMAPTKGTLTVLGAESQKLSPRELVQIGYVSEQQKMPGRTQVGAYLRYLRPFYPRWDQSLETEIVTQLGLPLERRIRDLSHGMRIKMALACALPYRPRLLVLDEPFSGLDPLVREEFMGSLLRHAGDVTVFISSHELSEIEDATTHVAFLDSGALLLQESMADLKARLRGVRVTLDAPARLPRQLPPEWLDVRLEGDVLRFIDTRDSTGQIGERIAAAIGPAAGKVRQIETEPVPLRSIFTTLARAERERKAPKENFRKGKARRGEA
ncbi:MAG: ABC transporter ATP-binding protein [Bryobacterales bacterium]|nr:ABC transporter ATP-binding protein [Bryobacterales bacterium]MBV9397509.1 ABC transporter ATP-binding protein [Bryobacterales bacterium]